MNTTPTQLTEHGKVTLVTTENFDTCQLVCLEQEDILYTTKEETLTQAHPENLSSGYFFKTLFRSF